MVRERVAGSVPDAKSGEGRGTGDPAEQRLQPAARWRWVFRSHVDRAGQAVRGSLSEEHVPVKLGRHLEVEF
jgi:hypothetical protein